MKESYLALSGDQILIYSAGVSGVVDGVMSGVSYGEWIRVALLELGPKVTKVFFYTRKKVAFNAVGRQQRAKGIINALKSL